MSAKTNPIRINDGHSLADEGRGIVMSSLPSFFRLVSCSVLVCLSLTYEVVGQFEDKSSDLGALPKAPPGFEITLFASEPMVRQPCSLAFDERGRLYVGMGPQYRNPQPDTPGDSVVIIEDTDEDGQADQTKVFATGFNAIQGLAWHGRELWIANAPDLTVVRDLNGDDEADEYVKVYTDLGNLEHGLHGLNWAPDGKLYMSKGNSKGLNQPGRYAPKPFRDLWGLNAPPDVPDFPDPESFTKENYRHAYHDPADDWGLDGGVLRCDDGGKNLEIFARGFRNPWDIHFDSGFNWIGTDNDQTTGDRVVMPFFGAHFGWNHPWSSHWGTEWCDATAPVSGPLFEGSGTGVVFCQSPQFPPEYRGVFLVNDWLLKTTYLWRPQWDGALLRPVGGSFTPFIQGGSSLYRPTDMEFGPDGALWVLGWSSGYGAEWKDGQLTNEGRIYRVAWRDAKHVEKPTAAAHLDRISIDDLISEFDSMLPVRRINAQDELVRRGAENGDVLSATLQRLTDGTLTENQETWTVWGLGRMSTATILPEFLHSTLLTENQASLNLQIQAVRILAYRAKQFSQRDRLTDCLLVALLHPQPRVRLATVQAIHETRHKTLLPQLLEAIHTELDPTVYYAGWQALRTLCSTDELRPLLLDSRTGVRRAALLCLLETHSATQQEVRVIAEKDDDINVRELAELWLSKSGESVPAIRGRSLQDASAGGRIDAVDANGPATIRDLKVKSRTEYKVLPGGFKPNTLTYVDRYYRLTKVPPELEGADFIQTANNDDNSHDEEWITADAIVPVRVWVGMDVRQKSLPSWLLRSFQKESYSASIDEGATFQFYSRTFDPGEIVLGGNTEVEERGRGNYIVAITPVPLSRPPEKTTVETVLAHVETGDRERGELLFKHVLGAACSKCHSIDQSKNGFGPSLSGIGLRSNAQHIVQSIVDPNAVITEGFNQLNVITDEGQVFSGVLLEESGLSLSLGQSNGERVDIPKMMISERKKSSVSAMPDMSELLTPQQVADLTAYLLSLRTQPAGVVSSSTITTPRSTPVASVFGVQESADRLRISFEGQHIVDFVFKDEKILRPYFANAKLAQGIQVTRNHPPISGEDAVDHDTMHPGIWLGFGDISGQDFWRNKATMEHVRFVTPPTIVDGRLKFANECSLKTSDGEPLCSLTNEFTFVARPRGWMLSWTAVFRADQRSIVFGDQEEMGFGARLATPFTEKNGGVIRSSTGKQSAGQTWGQSAKWCDYSGSGPESGGIMLIASDKNFRESWWHNRDYGVFVANPFGREAMRQGPRSAITIAEGDSLRITFGALIHDEQPFDPELELEVFESLQ